MNKEGRLTMPKFPTGKRLKDDNGDLETHCAWSLRQAGTVCRCCDKVHTPISSKHAVGAFARPSRSSCRSGNQCIYGDKCRYGHPSRCKNGDNCRFGVNCRFRHQPQKATHQKAPRQKAARQKAVACLFCDPKTHHCCPIHQ